MSTLMACPAATLCGQEKADTPSPPKSAPARRPAANNHPNHRAGEWLQQHGHLSPDQQQKALEDDPEFKKLPPQRQEQLRAQLRKFSSLTPEQQKQLLNRIQFMESLTPEQRQHLRAANQHFQGLPEDRKKMVRTALRHLRQMDPQGREQVFQSQQFRDTFSEDEQGLLRNLSEISPPSPLK
ncbi:MAG TPA: DUF3106 domain-containing protein [Candidatus Angelobacter sp.]|nr:DUF3106 domain-containing protein [Candidatus Angelobacter sp.]